MLEVPQFFLGWRGGTGRREAVRGWRAGARVADRRVRFPAVAALARARVAPCAAGARQSADCLRPRSPRRPRVRASAAPFVSGNRPHFHGDSSRFRVPRARPGHRRTAAFRRPAPGLRLRGGCGAMLSSRATPPAHPPRHASVGGVRAPSRSSRTVRSIAPRLSACPIAMNLCGALRITRPTIVVNPTTGRSVHNGGGTPP